MERGRYAPSSPGLRWGILGTANIAARAFLPALRAAGGVPAIVGSRQPERALSWAGANGVGEVGGYAEVVDSPAVDAIYIALPNDQHVEWTARAAESGKLVLCEKPLGLSAAEVAGLIASTRGRLVWESFVFPFHPQTDRLIEELAGGVIGAWREVHSEFHFELSDPSNLRLSATHGGGALLDVGCYPIRLARLLFGSEPVTAAAMSHCMGGEVEIETAGLLGFADERTLLFSAGFRRGPSTVTRVIGSTGELRLTNPFHPRHADTMELWRGQELIQRWPAEDGTAFEYAIRHIHDVAADRTAARFTIADDALGQAAALDLVRSAWSQSARIGQDQR